MERKTITITADTHAALKEWKGDDETWDAFMRSLIEGPDESGDYPSAEDIATKTARMTADEIETRLR